MHPWALTDVLSGAEIQPPARVQPSRRRPEPRFDLDTAEEADPLARLIGAVRAFEAGQPALDDTAAIFMKVADTARE